MREKMEEKGKVTGKKSSWHRPHAFFSLLLCLHHDCNVEKGAKNRVLITKNRILITKNRILITKNIVPLLIPFFILFSSLFLSLSVLYIIFSFFFYFFPQFVSSISSTFNRKHSITKRMKERDNCQLSAEKRENYYLEEHNVSNQPRAPYIFVTNDLLVVTC